MAPARPLTVSVSPQTQTVSAGNTQNFTATVQNDPQNNGVTWNLSGTGCRGAACGTLSHTTSSSGAAITYTAPAAVPNPATVTLTATSVSDNAISASTTITIEAPGGLTGVFTYHNDLSRTGANSQEIILTPSNVKMSTFGKLFSCAVDGAVYAQPLWVAHLRINGGAHNVIFAASTRDTVYAFDADASPEPRRDLRTQP